MNGSKIPASGGGADALAHVARLLGVDDAAARSALTQRSITVRGQKTLIPLEPAGGLEACDALAKDVYGRLFEWLVTKVNKAIKVESDEGKRGGFIGVLDIFGFEIFECNSFEQLCINFCNEKLQQHFNKATFKLEEMVYTNEEIAFEPIVFVDNQPVLDLIEHKASKKTKGGVATGILILLDDEIKLPGGNDDSFMTKTIAAHTSHPNFEIDDARRRAGAGEELAFTVKHYAGEVVYDAVGWSEKNRDTLWPDLRELCEASESALIRKLYKVKGESGGAGDLAKARKAMRKGGGGKSAGGGGGSKRTLGGQFRKQVRARSCIPSHRRSLAAFVFAPLPSCSSVSASVVCLRFVPHPRSLPRLAWLSILLFALLFAHLFFLYALPPSRWGCSFLAHPHILARHADEAPLHDVPVVHSLHQGAFAHLFFCLLLFFSSFFVYSDFLTHFAA